MYDKLSTYPNDIIGRAMRERRSIEEACADLRAKHEKCPTPALARMIEQLEAELTERFLARSKNCSARIFR